MILHPLFLGKHRSCTYTLQIQARRKVKKIKGASRNKFGGHNLPQVATRLTHLKKNWERDTSGTPGLPSSATPANWSING